MARIFMRNSSGELAMVNPKTLLQTIAASGHRVCIQGVALSMKGTSPTDAPVLFQVANQSTAIGGTPTATNPVKKNLGDPETVQTTGFIYGTSPTEPTMGSVQFDTEVHPQSPYYLLFPPGQELMISNGGRTGFKVTTALTYNAIAAGDLEE